ncbi:MAG: hypothetical protein NTW85_10265 [Methylococcales bacterium]|nr:hypothetical protein [Methylococcales bacterium]
MIIFDTRFVDLRNTYIFPLIPYGKKCKDAKHFDLKNILSSKVEGVVIGVTNNNYSLKINKDIFFSSLICDVELFYTRMIVQYVDLHKNSNISHTWKYVTSYYLFFFSITTLLRLLHKGFVFFDGSQAKELSDILTILGGEAIQINKGNYSFSVSEILTDYVTIELKSADSNAHQNAWKKIKEVIDEPCKKNNDEKSILNKLSHIMNRNNMGEAFPSETRNKINYNGIYGLETALNNIYNNGLTTDTVSFLKQILSYEKPLSDDINSQIKYSCLYGSYVFSLTHKLYEEYRTRSKKPENYFHNLRAKLLKSSNIELKFLDDC